MTLNASDGNSDATSTFHALIPQELLAGAGFTACDVALCSSDEARSLLSSSDALSLEILPLALQRGASKLLLHVAAEEDTSTLRKKVRFLTGLDVVITSVSREILKDAIPRAYYGSDERLAHHLKRLKTKSCGEARDTRPQCPKPRGDAAQFISALLEYASVRGASDLHLAPGIEGVTVKLRINGELLVLEQKPYDSLFHEQVASRLKVLARLDISQRKVPQDGAFCFKVGTTDVSVRISALPSIHGESIVIRFLRAESIPQIVDLGMEPVALSMLRAAIDRSEGLILLTGPTGSGKTTTMYSVVAELDHCGRNVVTVEDPVESHLRGIVQVQVSLEQGLDYPRAIRSVLRHDPDVLLIGEMRDGVSASIGLDAASTGHLTLSSLHIGSSLHVFMRMEALGVSRARVIPALALVLNQRLLPKLCASCKVEDVSGEGGSQGAKQYRAHGCSRCSGSGFQGRVLITELLDLQSHRAKESCYLAKGAQGLLAALPQGAFVPWAQSLRHHLYQGEISMEQVTQFVDSGEGVM